MLKIKQVVKRVIYFIDYIFLRIFGGKLLERSSIKAIHFSIDDIFSFCVERDEQLEDDLARMHKLYNVKCHLYIFYKYGDKYLQCISDKFQKLEWMEWGPHQAEYLVETIELLKNLKHSTEIRLHNYLASQEEIAKISQEGYTILLTADSPTRCSYNLSDEEIVQLNNDGVVVHEGITYVKTDIRLEKSIILQLLQRKSRYATLVCFTHEKNWTMVRNRAELLFKIAYTKQIKFR